jgi:ATP-dependent Clp protease ATP-binding subunit ClpA
VIEAVIAKMAKIPTTAVTQDDRKALRNLEADLHRMVYGQDRAIKTLTNAIKLSRAGLRDAEKPVGCYLFSGPTGVGKTEIAKQLSLTMGVKLHRFDMSEYMERHAVSRLIGAPPGYVGYEQGGLLTDAIDQNPHAILLLDEIEKAHPDLFAILLQMMDYGRLTDSNGKTVDCRHVMIIMTTNAGAADMAKPALGFERTKRVEDDEEAIKRLFTPEFRNRLDAIVAFDPLVPETVAKVVDKFVMRMEEQLADKKVSITLEPAARAWLAERGYDRAMGARPLARLIDKYVKQPLAEELLFGDLVHGGDVHVGVIDDAIHLRVQPLASKKVTVPKAKKPSAAVAKKTTKKKIGA